MYNRCVYQIKELCLTIIQMDYKELGHEIDRRRLELQQKMLEITLRQSQLEQELAVVEQELGGLNQIQTGSEIAAGHQLERRLPRFRVSLNIFGTYC